MSGENVPEAGRRRGSEVRGGNILALLAALGPHRALGERLLAEFGMQSPGAESWYELEGYIRVLERIGGELGHPALHETGRRIPEYMAIPPMLADFPRVCASFDRAFQINHRGTDGGIDHRMIGARRAQVVSRTPYPCAFDEGVIYGFFDVLMAQEVWADHDPDAECKARGGRSCTYEVRL